VRKRLGIYLKAEFDKLVEFIQRVPSHRYNGRRLLEELYSLFTSTGKLAGYSEKSRLWHEMSQTPRASALEITGYLDDVLQGKVRIDPADCPSELEPYIYKAARKLRLGQREVPGKNALPSFKNIDWDALSAEEEAEFRRELQSLKSFFMGFITTGAPRKDDLSTLLLELGRIWVEQTGWKSSVYDLPYSRNSRFIQFSSVAMSPLAHGTETSPIALSRRWERLSKDAKAEGE